MTAAQARALETLSAKYLLTLPDGDIAPSFWAEAFERTAPLAIEIGFGNGAALTHLAKAHPDWNCVGVDIYRPGFGALMLACENDDVDNVRVVETEALGFIQRLPPASVHVVNVFFPDPWPKARHHKRRLVNAEFATAVAHCLEPDGTLALATDWAEYAEQIVGVLAAEPSLQGGPIDRPTSRPMTSFEAKGVAAGRAVADMRYRRLSTPTRISDQRPLDDALLDLDSILDDANEDELALPDASAITNARVLLPKLFEILPVRYRVSPTERRGVAIDAPMRHGASVAVECGPEDTVYCFAIIDGNSRRAKFYQVDGLPDEFIKKALRDLGAG